VLTTLDAPRKLYLSERPAQGYQVKLYGRADDGAGMLRGDRRRRLLRVDLVEAPPLI